jgi:phage baseplate assembly protein W
MAFGAVQISPNDTRPRVGIGVDIPFSAGGIFTPNYLTKQAVKNNLINYFLTNPGERPGNPEFGGGLRRFIFEQIASNTLEYLQEDIQVKISTEFPQITLKELKVLQSTYDIDSNIITVEIYYFINNTGIEDELILNFN